MAWATEPVIHSGQDRGSTTRFLALSFKSWEMLYYLTFLCLTHEMEMVMKPPPRFKWASSCEPLRTIHTHKPSTLAMTIITILTTTTILSGAGYRTKTQFRGKWPVQFWTDWRWSAHRSSKWQGHIYGSELKGLLDWGFRLRSHELMEDQVSHRPAWCGWGRMEWEDKGT